MPSRSAEAAITGYFYQFDKTILQFLESDDDSIVGCEFIEDISVETATEITAIQCKYIPSQSLSDSVVRKPITLMLEDFIARPQGAPDIKYMLYGYFANGEKLPEHYTTDDLKRILTFRRGGTLIRYCVDRHISDDTLASFAISLIPQAGLDYAAQQARVISAIRKVFGCSEVDADLLYYCNALRVISALAREPEASNRKLKRRDFLLQIGVRSALFNAWYMEHKGEAAYKSFVLEKIRSLSAMLPSKRRTVFVGCELLTSPMNTISVAQFIRNLSHHTFRPGHSFYNHLPITVILDLTRDEMIPIKRELVRQSVNFSDAYEHIEFSPAVFNQKPIIIRNKVGNRGGEKVARSSFEVKLLSVATLEEHLDEIESPDSVLFLSGRDPSSLFSRSTTVIPVTANCLDSASAILLRT